MENVVAARRLRKTMIRDSKEASINILDNIDIVPKKKHKVTSVLDDMVMSKEDENFNNGEKFRLDFKSKFIIKAFIAVLIVFVCLIGKLFPNMGLLNNKYISSIIGQYNKDYSKEDICTIMQKTGNKFLSVGKYIVPPEVSTYVKNGYNERVKGKILNFELKDTIATISGDKVSNVVVEENKDPSVVENIPEANATISNEQGVGGGEPMEEKQADAIAVSSGISMMEQDVQTVMSKSLDIIAPISGTITSVYGARDQIFEGVNSYHTGLDIANKEGTDIKSACDAEVISVENNNKYYGNNVEILRDGIVFKYAHMSQINVKQGDKIKQGDIVGKVGSTGMSTGPHVHFEIKVDGRTVDPLKVVKVN